MMRKILAMLLAVLMLSVLVACGDKQDDTTGDTVINVGSLKMTYRAENGDTFTYEYDKSTTVIITGFSGNDEPHVVTIPATIEDKTVVAIGDEAFFACSNISAVELPEGLTAIGNYAFANCEALKEVRLPSTLKTIGDCAFYSCDALSAASLGRTALVSIGQNAYTDCVALTEVSFPSTLNTIEAGAFLNCTALSSLTLPEGVATVQTQAFYNCTALSSLSLPASLTEIGAWAFNPALRDLADEAIVVLAGSYAEEYIQSVR